MNLQKREILSVNICVICGNKKRASLMPLHASSFLILYFTSDGEQNIAATAFDVCT